MISNEIYNVLGENNSIVQKQMSWVGWGKKSSN